jgi:hypothetical protein
MKTISFALTALATVAMMLGGCDKGEPDPEQPGNDTEEIEQPGSGEVTPEEETGNTGPLLEISGKIDQVYERRPNTDPEAHSPYRGHKFKFTELDPADYTIFLRVEKQTGDRTVATFDIASAKVSKDGSFTLKMPAATQPEWLGSVADEMENLFNEGYYYGSTPEWTELPGEVEISDPDMEACVAELRMERADGLMYYVSFGGPDKESYHATDLSSVATSYLFYSPTAVEVAGQTELPNPFGGIYGDPRGFEIDSPGGWNWIYVIVNGMAQYEGWATDWPGWAVMTYSAHAIYDD